MEESFVYCGKCGHAMAEPRPLRRTGEEEKKVAGVCSGVAKHFHVDETLVRVVWAGSAMLPLSPGLLAYLLCWAVIPKQEAVPEVKATRFQRLVAMVPGRRNAA